jgi:hypothetical protein
LSLVSDGRLTPGQTGRLTVGRKLTSISVAKIRVVKNIGVTRCFIFGSPELCKDDTTRRGRSYREMIDYKSIG